MKKIILVIVSLILVTACSSELKRTVGLSKTAPNEYAVLRQPPLSMPPTDYLVPPGEQNKLLLSNASGKESKDILYGSTQKEPLISQSLDSSDRNFIEKTSYINKDKNIKDTITEENKATEKPQKKSLLNIFKRKDKTENTSKPDVTSNKITENN